LQIRASKGAEAPILLIALDPSAKADGKGYQYKSNANHLGLNQQREFTLGSWFLIPDSFKSENPGI